MCVALRASTMLETGYGTSHGGFFISALAWSRGWKICALRTRRGSVQIAQRTLVPNREGGEIPFLPLVVRLGLFPCRKASPAKLHTP